MSELIGAVLRRRVRTNGSQPLITYYDLGSGERTELSAISFANWVDKTSNLLLDELMVEPGASVELQILRSHPGHWVSAIWASACWQIGATVTVTRSGPPAVLVVGPASGWTVGVDTPVVVCSLDPLGRGLAGPPGPPVLDYATEVRGQPDSWAPMPVSGLAEAYRDGERQLDQLDLLQVPPSAERRLIRPGTPWPTLADGLVAPLLGGGSTVIVVGEDETRIAGVATGERAVWR